MEARLGRAQGFTKDEADRQVGVGQRKNAMGNGRSGLARLKARWRKPRRRRIPTTGISQNKANLRGLPPTYYKKGVTSSVRWRHHEFAGTRRRDGGDRHPENIGKPLLTLAGTVGDPLKFADETDIVKWRSDACGKVTIDAFPRKFFTAW